MKSPPFLKDWFFFFPSINVLAGLVDILKNFAMDTCCALSRTRWGYR
ncbi:MAG: hypothetical protein JSW56_18865 [Deltaproteobacteria bacterium]|nr:MAG: hypothetical protein JSW56_18865 [Deltaproteobacteria bacterium]